MRAGSTWARNTCPGGAANSRVMRMIGTSAAVVTAQLANVMPGATPFVKLAYAAAAVAFSVYLIATIASAWLPEPERDKLME